MTREEVKDSVKMSDVLARYSFRASRSGFIQCPFHKGDRQASLKVYEKDFNCFACGANGDIFTFVMLMEGVSFKEAFCMLGGTYEKPTFSTDLAIYRANARRRREAKLQKEKKEKRDLNNALIAMYRKWYLKSEPFSDAWCECFRELQKQLYILETINEGGVMRFGVD